ncbi:uncharacterized protein LOC117390212 [Periophthalmus magnuspinnatus]|uniref:uncharacterized protein LOC117390212 n=1 Tax=Periophthalmus magnuspinnatus TaxID=409849 RepID=UPI00145B3BD1|nr:uncharacterized protein LOC117390212 [Periophthalmus magnuspinnatus]
MHLKSCPKLLRSELRLDLGQQQGALLRRGQSLRVPLAALSTNTLRCSPVGGAVLAARAKGSENAVFTEEEGGGLDVWSVIKPGHVREKIALFAHDTPNERNAKGSWDVTAKRRRRASQIQPAQVLQSPQAPVTLSLQPAPRELLLSPLPPLPPLSSPDPSDPVEDDSKLSVVEMVAFLEQRVITRSPHAKLRSSTSIMLSRAQPPSSASLLADPQPVPPSDRPISLQQGEEPDSVSVSDMVAKLESQCLRRRTQSEQRTVGRVLLAEQNHAQLANTQPISISKPLKATLTDSSTTETRKTSVSFCKTDVKVKVTCFSTDTKEVIKTVTKNTPTMPERSDAIGRGRTQSPPSCQSKPAQLSSQVKLNTTQKCESKETQKSPASTADILRPPVRSEVALAKMIKMEDVFCVKDVTKPDPKPDDAFKTVGPSCVKLKNTPLSEFKTEKSHESPKLEEPLPGLLFLTPPSKVASLSPNSHSDSFLVLSRSELVVQSEQRKTEWHHSSSNSDSFTVLSLDLTGQSQTRTQCSFSLSPASSLPSDQLEKKKHQRSQSPTSTCDSTPIRTLQSSSRDLMVQSEKRKAKSDSNLSHSSLDFVIQSKTSKPSSVQSERSCLMVTKASCDQTDQLQNSSDSFIQSEKRKSCPVTASEFSIQSKASIELLPIESQSQRRRLNRIAQSEKRKSCPVMVSDWTNSQYLDQSQTLKAPSDSALDTSQSEQRRPFLAPPSGQSEARSCCSVLRSSSDAAVLLRSSSDVGSERRRRRKATRTFSVGEGRVSEDFLLMRRRVQSLLEPRSSLSYLSLLPHHLLLQILLHLPTRALAALKCTCHYLRLVIDTYDPRPLDALWVCDPRYRDDPCKQCKRRHQRGDVSLCRWHHKPFCQAMPYGPGYWMCCHGDRRDAPGCNVGLHDNRWVPAFHSINAPIYRQRPREEDET